MTKKVTIDIGKVPGRHGIKRESDNYNYYDDDHRERVDVTLTESFQNFPGYVTLTHRPTNGNTIGSIEYNRRDGRNKTGLSGSETYKTVTVYYWSKDEAFDKPLLLKLSGKYDKYYAADKEEKSSQICSLFDQFSTSKCEGVQINDIDLKKVLDRENCKRNGAHQIDISKRSSGNMNTNYPCPSCRNKQQIQISYQNTSEFTFCTHSIGGSRFSVSGFKDGSIWQVGLPSIRNVNTVTVYYYPKVGGTPVLIHYQKSGEHWFKRNTKTSNTWIALPNETNGSQALELLNDRDYYHSITLDLSKPANVPYPDESTGISITVRSHPIGDGYRKHEHSLCGGLFKVTQVKHGQGTTLEGISSNYPIESVTAYYNGDDYITKDPILVELALVELIVKNNSKTRYTYYGRSTARQNSWHAFIHSDNRCDEHYLKKKLKSMRKTKSSQNKTTDIIETSLIVSDVLAGGGTMGYGGWKLWLILATRL